MALGLRAVGAHPVLQRGAINAAQMQRGYGSDQMRSEQVQNRAATLHGVS